MNLEGHVPAPALRGSASFCLIDDKGCFYPVECVYQVSGGIRNDAIM